MQKITPFLWYDGKAEEAAEFYVSIFKNSRIHSVNRYTAESPGQAGAVTSVSFVLDGQEVIALNGGPMFNFTPAISFYVNCETQREVDELWEKLTEGGTPVQCGWLTDKFGLSWQIIPSVLTDMLGDKDPKKSQRVMQAMLEMTKLDVAGLKRAYDGK